MAGATTAREAGLPSFVEALESRQLLNGIVAQSDQVPLAPSSVVVAAAHETITSTRAEVYYDQDPHLLRLWGNVHTDISLPSGGLMQFIDEDTGVVLANGQVLGGEARATAGGLQTRLYHVYANFIGDNLFGSSRGQTVEVAVGKSASVTRLSDAHLITIDQPPAQFDVMVGSYSPADKPTLTIYDGDSVFKTVDVQRDPSGPFLGSFDTSGLTVGSHTLRAVFAGDAWNFASEATVIQVIKPVPVATTIALESSTPSIVNPHKFTLTAHVTAADGSTVENGEVRFTDGQLVNEIRLVHDGVAQLEVGGWLVSGAHSFIATYDGGAELDYAASGPGEVIVQVEKGETSLSLTVPTTVQMDVASRRITLTARVFDADGNRVAGGSIRISDPATGEVLSEQAASNDPATLGASIVSGRNVFLATYDGLDAMLTSSTTFEVMVTRATTTVHVVGVGGLSPLIAASMPAIVKKHPFLPAQVFYPTGTMVFMDGETILGEMPVQGSGAVWAVPKWTDGEHVLRAHYSGDDDFEPADSDEFRFTCHRVDVQVQVSRRTEPDQPIALSGKVKVKQTGEPLTGISQGLVTFVALTAQDKANMRAMDIDTGGWIYGRWITDAYIDENGEATRSVDSLPAGTQRVVAVFSGITKVVEGYPNSGFNSGRGLTFGYESQVSAPITVAQATGLKLQKWFAATPTHPPTFTATVTNPAGQGFRQSFSTPSDIAVPRSNTVSLSIHVPRPLPRIRRGTPLVTLGGTSLASNYDALFAGGGFNVIFHYPPPPLPPVPTGIVRFMRGDQVLAEVPLDSYGTATFVPPRQALGDYQISAVYVGDQNYEASASSALPYIVARAATFTKVTASAHKLIQGRSFTLTTTASTLYDYVAPEGWVALRDGKKQLARLRLGAKMKIVDWDLPVGTHWITASYEGDANCLASRSTAIKVQVKAART